MPAAHYYDSSIIDQIDTDAKFRAWVLACITALTDVGLVQTADTGQIDPATVSAPPSSGSKQGYAIFRFNDALQATLPIFIRLDFGTVFKSGTDTRPTLWVTVGTSTNGSGTLGGQTAPEFRSGHNAATANGEVVGLRAAATEDGAGVILYHGPNAASANKTFCVMVERWRDKDGTQNADGYTRYADGASDGDRYDAVPASGAGLNSTAIRPGGAVSSQDGAWWGTGASIHMYPWWHWDTDQDAATGLVEAVLGLQTGGAAIGAVLDVAWRGETKTYIVCRQAPGYSPGGPGGLHAIPYDDNTGAAAAKLPGEMADAVSGGGGGGGTPPPTVGQLWPRGNPS